VCARPITLHTAIKCRHASPGPGRDDDIVGSADGGGFPPGFPPIVQVPRHTGALSTASAEVGGATLALVDPLLTGSAWVGGATLVVSTVVVGAIPSLV
jgi:hypothetical protein